MLRESFKLRRRKKSDEGFTLLLAALVSSIVLSVGAAIFGIAQKQVLLSAIGRDSQFAFYAADTAAECALYWDFRFGYFATSSPSGVDPRCDGPSMNFKVTDGDRAAGSYYTMTSDKIDLFADIGSNLCAGVIVKKCKGTFNSSTGACENTGPTSPVRTSIHADGYSTSCASIDTSSRALQRSVELHY